MVKFGKYSVFFILDIEKFTEIQKKWHTFSKILLKNSLYRVALAPISRVFAYLGAYDYCFCQLFQGLRLFGGLSLFETLEYRISLNNKRAYYYFYKFLDAQTIQGRALIKGANYFLPGP